jgi:hypothetical protein
MEPIESPDQSALFSGPLFINRLKATNIVVYSPSTHRVITAKVKITHKKYALGNTSLSNCIIHSCKITKAILKGCFIFKCKLKDCSLQDCKLVSSSIYDSSFKNCSRRRCTVTPLPHIYRLPREIRDKIFYEAIEWDGKTPVLIAALRGDPMLYQEALRILSKEGVFVFHLGNRLNRAIALPSSFKGIERIHIK